MDWAPASHGHALGRFEILELVGSGAFGAVYKARDRELGRIVAIKVPRVADLGNSGDSDRFLREARSVAQLRHRSIVPVFEIGQESGRPFLVSEFVHGVTLADLLTSDRLPPRVVAELVAEIADALDYAHKQGVIHRDVKPSNIMLEAPDEGNVSALRTSLAGHPRLMDFGLAKREGAEVTMTTEGQVLGTPAYMSPEQARGESHSVDGRSDVYSLGVILYQLLVGELPFKGNARMLLHQVLYEEPKPPRQCDPKVPKDLQTICLKAMAKEPSGRYETAGEVAADLRRFVSGEPIRARPVGRAEKVARWCRRNKAVACLGTLVVVLLGLLVATGPWRARPHRPPRPPRAPHPDFAKHGPADELLEVVTDLDRTDPGWRLEEIEAKRKAIPDDRNAAQKVRAILKILEPLNWPSSEVSSRFVDASKPSPERLRSRDAADLGAELKRAAPALAEARLLTQYPEGRIPIAWSRIGIPGTVMPEHQALRAVVRLLQWDAVLEADRGHMRESLESCRAIFHCCRIIGDDPTMITQIQRGVIARLGAMTLERALAQGEADGEALKRLQELIAEEAAHPRLAVAARGERGSVHWLMSAIAAGDARLSELAGSTSFSEEITKQLSNGQTIRALHAQLLREITRWVRATQKPLSEQESWVREWEASLKQPGHELALQFAGGARGLTESAVSLESWLNCAIAGLAVERYRLAKKSWPANLESLMPEYSWAVPLDPYDNKPLRFRRDGEALRIYSIGPDRTDNQGKVDPRGRQTEGTDISFELWPLEKRGTAASE